MKPHIIPTHIINLARRPERKAHAVAQFAGKPEFNAQIVKAIEDINGAFGLWQTVLQIVKQAKESGEEYVLICEDDHQFTGHYDAQKLFAIIEKCKHLQADVLMGGVSWFEDALQIDNGLFWVNHFNGTQFILVYSRIFDKLLAHQFITGETVDKIIYQLSKDKFVIYPFISTQKEFGYSDATAHNNTEGYVNQIFENSDTMFSHLVKADNFYRKIKRMSDSQQFDDITIPTYLINLEAREERREHILQQFADKPEFTVQLVKACDHKVGAIGLWQSILKIINLAIENDDDVIIICEDDHEFTEAYNKSYLLSNIIGAHEQGVEILSGGIGHFGYAVPLTANRFWVNPFQSAQFIVLYKNIFAKILKYKFKKTDVADLVLANLTSHKMALYPYISRQKDFGYSDVTDVHNAQPGLVQEMFRRTERRFEELQHTYLKHRVNNKPADAGQPV